MYNYSVVTETITLSCKPRTSYRHPGSQGYMPNTLPLNQWCCCCQLFFFLLPGSQRKNGMEHKENWVDGNCGQSIFTLSHHFFLINMLFSSSFLYSFQNSKEQKEKEDNLLPVANLLKNNLLPDSQAALVYAECVRLFSCYLGRFPGH